MVLLMGFSVSTLHAQKKESAFTKVLRAMFPSAKPKVVPKKKRKPASKPKKEKPSKTDYFTVDIDWMAKYWEQEAAWDYYIPEDDQIRFQNGQYNVPIVVYKHYEDMHTSVRRPAPTPVPRPDLF